MSHKRGELNCYRVWCPQVMPTSSSQAEDFPLSVDIKAIVIVYSVLYIGFSVLIHNTLVKHKIFGTIETFHFASSYWISIPCRD